jgi:7,8-dihydroneopterin aldolase/epimerase/oxygenase
MTAALDPLLLQCRRIFVRDYVLPTQIGVHAFERTQAQRLIFNVELYVAYEQSTARNDRLEEVVDYDFVRETIAHRVAQGHVALQETLCDDLARQLLSHPRIRAVRVSSCKPDVYPDCAGVGVEVFKCKPEPA